MIFVNYFKRLSCGCLYSLSTILTLHVTAVTVSKYWLELGRMRLTELIYADTSLTTTLGCKLKFETNTVIHCHDDNLI